MWFRSNMVVAMSPQHAALCAPRVSLALTCTRASPGSPCAARAILEARRQLASRARRRHGRSDPEDDDCPIKAVKDPERLHLIVAGGMGPITAVCHGWNESSAPVCGTYDVL